MAMSVLTLLTGPRSLTRFEQQGYIGPIPILTDSQRELLVRHLRRGKSVDPPIWKKARAVTDYLFYDIATQPALLGLLRLLLGENVILWGASIQSRTPGQVHPWHVDIETSRADMRSVSVWIGIENVCRKSSLQVISGSHRFGRTVQEVVHAKRLRRGDASGDVVETWAREIHAAATLVQLDMGDGEAILFDGRLWHGTENTRAQGTRTAMLLQYAAADERISVPDFSQLDWPFRYRPSRAPILEVCGVSSARLHKRVKPPSLARSGPVSHVLHELQGDLEDDPKTGWKPHPIFRGCTTNLEHLTIHASVLSPGRFAHPPHAHPEEEILVVLDGQAECVIAEDAHSSDPRVEVLERGEFVYYPAYQYHTIRNATQTPITYLMFKWRGSTAFAPAQFSAPVLRPGPLDSPAGRSFAPYKLTEFPTSYLTKLHAHYTVLAPGGGYPPHVDKHDVAILLLDGCVETQGRHFGPNSILLHSAGNAHGIHNVGTEPARYLVFEFHAGKVSAAHLSLIQNRDDEALREHLAAARARVRSLKSDLARRKREAMPAGPAAQLAAIHASRSWRVTAPLRAITRGARRIAAAVRAR